MMAWFHYLLPPSASVVRDIVRTELAPLLKQGSKLMADIKEVSDTLDQIRQATGDYIARRDAIDAEKDAKIAELTAQLGAVPAEVQAGIDAALQKAKDDLALLTPPA